MNFAPYQDDSPETERALSPTLADANRSKSPQHARSPRASPPVQQSFQAAGGLPSPSHFVGGRNSVDDGGFYNNSTSNSAGGGFGSSSRDVEGGRLSLGAFETSLPIRMDFEAMLAYLLLPPAGGVFLLLVEHKSDYVRYVVS